MQLFMAFCGFYGQFLWPFATHFRILWTFTVLMAFTAFYENILQPPPPHDF
jgi:hypothetical protein